jgi:hypothetical protein
MRYALCCAAIAVALCVLAVTGCSRVQPPAAVQEIAAVPVAVLPGDTASAEWNSAQECVVPLLLQDMVEPRQLKVTTAEVRVRALTSGSEVAFRIEWKDATQDDLPGPAHFCDACAVQVPAKVDPTVPAPQMGETGKSVEITYWNAAWQAVVNGREDAIKALYPNAAIDHYPYEAPSLKEDSPEQREMSLRYAPARALGNPMAGPRTAPVQDLIAEGPGTLTPAAQQVSKGTGVRTADGWVVVIARHLPAGFWERNGTQVAFAVWEGAKEEVGARKMRTAWIPMSVRSKQP